MSLGDRVRKIRESQTISGKKMTQEAFGESLGVSRSVIANIEYGRGEPNPAVLRLICKTYNVNLSWLMDGEGEMCPPETEDDLTVKIVRLLEGENETAKKVFQAFASFGEDDWKTVQRFIDGLISGSHEGK